MHLLLEHEPSRPAPLCGPYDLCDLCERYVHEPYVLCGRYVHEPYDLCGRYVYVHEPYVLYDVQFCALVFLL
jgi:hypothetical protein|tara:strand:- start:318 stop:533 length:216 start_codon:yes stop_codon:yes gene_type:complete